MTSHSSPSHRSTRRGASLAPDPVVTLPARRGSSRRMMIRRSWVRALGASGDRRHDLASGLVVRQNIGFTGSASGLIGRPAAPAH